MNLPISSTQAIPKSFQLKNLMSKAHELSSQCDAEVLLIVGKESKYFAYSSFDRAESMRTVLKSSNTKVLRPSAFGELPSTPKDTYIPEGEHAPTSLPNSSAARGLMSIGYLCSPAAQKVYEGKKGRIDLQGDAAQCRPEYSDAACPESSMSDETLAAHDECSVTDAVFNPRSKKENQRDSSAKPEKLVELTAKSSDIDTDVNSITGGEQKNLHRISASSLHDATQEHAQHEYTYTNPMRFSRRGRLIKEGSAQKKRLADQNDDSGESKRRKRVKSTASANGQSETPDRYQTRSKARRM